ncbi:uncharacterized protein LOC110940087 [Helianthus annuus]|uniref:uncharacterized protein LOC110940087 n=1 Tax=Helianthus annuus TaxID=4232 RepID=UPI000B9075A7|nr:uncharacterized protein LOC110940087 [Helianthus annuus]
MDGDPFGYWDLLCDNLIPPEVFYKGVYYSFIGSGLYLTAEVFRREIEGDVTGDNSLEWLLIDILNGPGQMEWEPLLDDEGSSYNDENSMRRQSGVTPSIDHGLNEHVVEELTLNEIFGNTDNQGLVPVVEACRSSNVVSNECCVKAKEDDTHDFAATNDPVEPLSLVNGKKNEEGDSCSQDAYLYDSSSFDLGNKDDGVISAFNFNEYHEAPYRDEMRGVTTGGNLVLQTMPHPERLMPSSTPARIEDTDVLGPHSLAQTVPRTTEIASNEHGGDVYVPGGSNRRPEIWYPLYMKSFPIYPSFCSKNKGASTSQDVNMHDSSLNGKGNEDKNMISLRNLYEHHELSKNDDSKGTITGGKLPEGDYW